MPSQYGSSTVLYTIGSEAASPGRSVPHSVLGPERIAASGALTCASSVSVIVRVASPPEPLQRFSRRLTNDAAYLDRRAPSQEGVRSRARSDCTFSRHGGYNVPAPFRRPLGSQSVAGLWRVSPSSCSALMCAGPGSEVITVQPHIFAPGFGEGSFRALPRDAHRGRCAHPRSGA